MIYTLTLNPALDYIVRVDNLDLGETNRTTKELIKAGGKGINVSKIFTNLGEENIALGFIAGFTGNELNRKLKEEDINTKFIEVENGFTRINIKIKAEDETEINGKGPEISDLDVKKLYKQLDELENGDYLFLSGSIPKSLNQEFYKEIMKYLQDKNIKIIVDATGNLLKETLEYNPFLIKPNKRELEELFNYEIKNNEDIVNCAKKLQQMGAKNIIISLGGDGAFLLTESGKEIFEKAPKGDVVDTVGSGDSMIAGYTYGIIKNYSNENAFKFAISCGSATAFTSDIANKEQIIKIFEKIGGNYEN